MDFTFDPETKRAEDKVDDVPIDWLDYAHVEKCTNVKELLLIQATLESGNSGSYPQLERSVHERILAVATPVERGRYLAQRGILPEGEAERAARAAAAFAGELHAAEAEALRAPPARRELPPVRGPPDAAVGSSTGKRGASTVAAAAAPAAGAPEGGGGRVEPKAAPIQQQYKKWESFDTEEALRKADEELAAQVRWRPPSPPPPYPPLPLPPLPPFSRALSYPPARTRTEPHPTGRRAGGRAPGASGGGRGRRRGAAR